MNPMPVGWWIGVEGPRVVVSGPGLPDEKIHLSVREARLLRNQLHLAYLIAQRQRPRQRHREVDPETLVAAYQVESEVDPESGSTGNVEDSGFSARRSVPGVHDDLSPMPMGWSVETAGRHVLFEVPASGVDGEFTLTPGEALIAGIALIRGSERARTFDDAIEAAASGFADEAHRQSALVAASSEAAEDQAWVDDISEFNDEEPARNPESEVGDQE